MVVESVSIFDTKNKEYRSGNNTDGTGMRVVLVSSKLLVLLTTKSQESLCITYKYIRVKQCAHTLFLPSYFTTVS